MVYPSNINLNLNTQYVLPIPTAQQGDTARVLTFNILDNGVPFNLTGKTVRAKILKPDNTKCYNDLTITNATGGECDLKLTTQVLAVAGKVNCQLEIKEGEELLSTIIFPIDVEPSIDISGAAESTNEFTALQNGITKLDEWDKYFQETSGAIEEKYTTRLNAVESSLEDKVNKERGKGLSTNDYSNLEKEEVAKIKNKADTIRVDELERQIGQGVTDEQLKNAVQAKVDDGTISSIQIGKDGVDTINLRNKSVTVGKTDFVTCGKNLFDKDDETMINRFTAPDGSGSNSPDWRQVVIPVIPSEKYTFSGCRKMICYYSDSDGVVDGGVDTSENVTIATPLSATKVKVSIKAVDLDKFMVEKSSRYTGYEPYIYKFTKSKNEELNNINYIILNVNPTNYRSTLESIKDNSSFYKRYILLLEQGVYDIYSMMTDYEKDSDTFCGLYTPKFTECYACGDVKIILESPSMKRKLSPVNLDVTASINNCTVVAKNCRYAIHDDWTERKWFDNTEIEDYWSEAFYKGFIRKCKNVTTEINGSYVGASWGCGTVNATNWIFENCNIGNSSEYSFICHNDNSSMLGANLTFINCRTNGGKIRFSSLNKGLKANCFAHMYGNKAIGVDLTEEDSVNFGSGIRWKVDGFGNTFNNSNVSISNTDGIDYKSNIDLI